ncbi:MAG: hypothetical protein NVS2B3_05500 [Vulcanimicrobiaceae bacterium]
MIVVPPASQSFLAPMSFAQQRLWTLDQIADGGATYNVPRTYRMRGPLDVDALRRALEAIVARHEILRTNFSLIDGEPVQIVRTAIDVPFELVDLANVAVADREVRATELVRMGAERSFDLAEGPLVRVTLVRLDERDHLALIAMHHIVTDEWSDGVFNRELAEFYAAERRGDRLEPAELPIQYADYATWQHESLQDSAIASDLAFWHTRLAGAPPRTALPTVERRDVAHDAGATHTAHLSETTSRALRALGAAHGATPFVTLLAAFYVVLYRYTGQADLVVGSPIADRQDDDLAGLIGFFLNTLALRVHVDPHENFGVFLGRVREASFEAFERRFVPFERVVADLDVVRTASDVPLVNVFFQVETDRSASLALDGLAVEPFELDASTAKFDLSLAVSERDTALACTFSYRCALFEPDFIVRLGDNFTTLLDAIVASPELAVGRLPLLTERERRLVVDDFNATARTYEPDETLLDLLDRQAEATPDAVALEWEDEAGVPHALDYATLHGRADERARQLRGLGVGPNVGVGIALSRSPDLIVAVLAVLKAGGYYVPLDPEYPPDRLAFMLEDSQVAVLIASSTTLPKIAIGDAAVVLADEPFVAAGSLGPVERARSSDYAYMIYTSGSTGRPKGALNRHAGIVNRLLWMRERYAIVAEDVVLHKTSFSFDISVWEILIPLVAGARILLARPGGQRDPSYLVALIERRRATVAHFVPSMLRLFVSTDGVQTCRSLRDVISSGEELPADLVRAFYERLAARLHNLYGPTEAAIEVTHFECPRDFDAPAVPIGWPVANTRMYVLDALGEPVPIGVSAELYIGGIQVGAGYHRRPELTAQRFVADPFVTDPAARLYRTGDLARYGIDGAIEYRGRLDTQVKLHGFRIELGEIESVLRRLPDVRDAAVVIRGERDDARIVAYVVSDDATRTAEEWRRLLGADLPSFMLPTVVRLAKLPLTPNGKLDYRALPEADRPSSPPAADQKNMLYRQLAAIWEAHLGHAPIGISENFFALGGSSLSAIRLVAEMSRTFGQAVPAARFFAAPTIAGVAAVLLDRSTAYVASPLVALQSAGTKTPFFFVDGDLHGGGYYVRGLARRLGDDRPLYALHMPGTHGGVLPESLEAVAAELCSQIRAVRPRGPYALGGFCVGGLVAFEIARRLQSAGETVEHLIVLESYGSNARLTAIAEAVERASQRIAKIGKPAPIRTTVARAAHRIERVSRQLRRMRESPVAGLAHIASLARERFEAGLDDDVVETHYRRLSVDYIPGRYRGTMTLLFVSVEPDPLDPDGYEPQWGRVVDDVRVGALVGTHLGCITHHIDETARTIEAFL